VDSAALLEACIYGPNPNPTLNLTLNHPNAIIHPNPAKSKSTTSYPLPDITNNDTIND